MIKYLVSLLILLSIAVSACSAPKAEGTADSPGAVPSPAPAPAPDALTASAEALGLTPGSVLNWAPYQGGQVGEVQFRPGRVLLWQPEAGRLEVSAAVAREDGTWKAGNSHSITILPVEPQFAPSVALVNPVDTADRKVPLNAIFGLIHHPDTSRVEVRLPGDGWHDAKLAAGTYLFVWQGVISDFEVVAFDRTGRELEKARVPSTARPRAGN
ncbi:MAG: hypothetical protein K0R39_2255 [Symbiobacteriaceae bacterium]|jgi:hypothetical protein|nr:hypothetical protein [Symbiobacteriaceae bacterium]